MKIVADLYSKGFLNPECHSCQSIKSWLAHLVSVDFDVVHDLEQLRERGESSLLDSGPREPIYAAGAELLQLTPPELLFLIGAYRCHLKEEIQRMASPDGCVSEKTAQLVALAVAADEAVEAALLKVLTGD